jgi:hypothetical protein
MVGMYDLGQFFGSLLAIWSLARLLHWILRWRTPVSAIVCGLGAGAIALTVSGLFDPGRSMLWYILATLIYIPFRMSILARKDGAPIAVKSDVKRDRKPRHME